MAVRSSSPERWCSSSALRLVVVRLAAVGMRDAVDACTTDGVCSADGVRATIGVHECANDGSRVP
jgi:hypothetical protein